MSDPVTKKSLELVADNSEPAAADTVSKKTVAENTILENDKEAIDISSPEYYENRELSHFKFNQRVLSQARNKKHPLLDRLMFLLIFSSNLDEFFEIRVSGLKKQLDFGLQRPGPDGNYPEEVLKIIHEEVREALGEQYRILNEDLLPSLAEEDIHFLPRVAWSEELIEWTKGYFHTEILPVVSPLGLDPAHPFPRLVNKSLNFILSLDGKDAFGRDSGLAIVPAPRSLPRLIKVPENLVPEGDNFIFLSSIIHAHVDEFFPGMSVTECHQFRVTRNSDLEMSNVEVEDFAMALQGQLHSRRFGAATKLEVGHDCPEELTDFLLERFNLTTEELYRLDGPVNLQRLMAVYEMVDRPDLQFSKFSPGTPKALAENSQIFSAVDKEDQLLLHPFQSFIPIIDWLRQAAKDPDVVSIKQTLYRTNESSELVEALAEAARNGKEVTVVIELRARFDEEENINFASILQEAGAVVVYGVMGYKTHAKMLLFVRRHGNVLKRYAHLGTGNYHRKNSLLYTDYSLMTADEIVCADVHKVFQQITGMGKKIHPKLLIHAPFNLRKSMVKLIEAEAKAASNGESARIVAKLNALTDVPVIKALYAASIAGVKIDLIVRGICCLRPGVPGVSENITVISTIGRFLEHSRVYYFKNAEQQVYCSSADWMERNLSNRIEVCFPILKKKHASRIMDELNMYLEDEGQSWELQTNGTYREISPELPSEGDVQNLLLQKLS
jgi:polyphosphate kinase